MTPTHTMAMRRKDDLPQDVTGSTIKPADSALVTALREVPSRLFVETTTRCNLKCGMCVKQTEDNGIVDGEMSPAIFSALEPAFPFAERLVLNGTGEPLLHPDLEAFVRKAKSLMPQGSWVGFQSNGLLVDEARATSLARAGLDRICLSMDSLSPDVFRQIREGGEVRDLERAFAALKTARKKFKLNPQVGIEFVLMRDNAAELPAVLRWASTRGATFAIVTHLLPYDANHATKIAYDSNTDEAVAFFEVWREQAKKEQINLETYFKVRWNYLRSPEEQRIVDFVSRMQADAHSRDVFFHLKNLMTRDEKWIQELGEIFEEAMIVARETGVDLLLPEITPKRNRKCDFINNGSAFISWNGDVHNCYFLWHKYSCFFSGRKRYVNTKPYGNLARRGILEIWNDAAFKKHRQDVLLQEYPSCSDCNLVPCEYIYREEFEHDCFTTTVPCGSCLWSLGMFRCLQ